jgi:hypothetical protein
VGWVLGEQRARQRGADARMLEALQDAAPGLREGNPHDAALIVAVQAARAQLDTGAVGPRLRGRAEQLQRDWEMLALLETARLQAAAGRKETGFDYAGADNLYAEAFRSYGLDVTIPEPQQAAGRIQTSAIRTHLVAALDHWAFVRDELQRGSSASLRAVADLADDDPWRLQLRATSRKARAALEKLAEAKGVLSQPPVNLVLLGIALRNACSGRKPNTRRTSGSTSSWRVSFPDSSSRTGPRRSVFSRRRWPSAHEVPSSTPTSAPPCGARAD